MLRNTSFKYAQKYLPQNPTNVEKFIIKTMSNLDILIIEYFDNRIFWYFDILTIWYFEKLDILIIEHFDILISWYDIWYFYLTVVSPVFGKSQNDHIWRQKEAHIYFGCHPKQRFPIWPFIDWRLYSPAHIFCFFL